MRTAANNKGKVKENKNYNAGFAALVSQLNGSDKMFIFSDDPGKMKGNDPGQVGEFNVEEDGSHFNIVTPDYSRGEKSRQTDLMGGRAAVLGEETMHATQLLKGDVLSSKRNGKYGLSVNSSTNKVLVEADAKLWVANSGMAKLTTSTQIEGYTFPSMMGLFKTAGNQKEVARILLIGTQVTRSPDLSSSPLRTLTYHPSYSPF